MMHNKCVQCGTIFEISANQLELLAKLAPTFDLDKKAIVQPTRCPDCRKQRRLAWRNERRLYSACCSSCKQPIVSIYSPASQYPVYCSSCWWGDSWSGQDFGREVDFDRPFFEQFAELQSNVPRLALFNSASENSDYTNHASRNKNCYYSFAIFDAEDVLYSRHFVNGRDCVDTSFCYDGCELCYECINCHCCYNLKFSLYCRNCSESAFLYDCQNCQHCYQSAGLRNKRFCYNNRQLSEKEWFEVLPTLSSHTTVTLETAAFHNFLLTQNHPWSHQFSSEDCSGDSLFSSSNCTDCYQMRYSEDVICSELAMAKSSCDLYGAGPGELLYETQGVFEGYHCLFCNASYYIQECMYIDLCQNSSNLFGCVGLKHAQYCILNRNYSKSDYEAIARRLVNKMQQDNEWGEFFPASISPFGYNETLAVDYFPLSREEALNQSFNWTAYEAPFPQVKQILSLAEIMALPDKIDEIPDEILHSALTCGRSGRLFRITPQELKFYRKQQLPLPRISPEDRIRRRASLINPPKLWHRQCSSCERLMQTTYSPNRPEKVLCESCYLKQF